MTNEHSHPHTQPPPNTKYPEQFDNSAGQKSLTGVNGALIFFIIIFSLIGCTYITIFMLSMINLNSSISSLVFVLSPIVALAAITSVVLIAMQKKTAKWFSIGTSCLSFLHTAATAVAIYSVAPNISFSRYFFYNYYFADHGTLSTTPFLLGGIFFSLICNGLFVLYFLTSERVRLTLTK
ncbi:MAG: hypothetical protein LBE03_02820 [Candidatus Nomurabacteria bacterium]|jgi:hypothetical protein|nr:hypothetical protein [Candidatus Nomurabacteria bacterium]